MLPTRNSVSEKVPAKAIATYEHAVIWLDHQEARVIRFNADDCEVEIVWPAFPAHSQDIRPGGPSLACTPAETQFFRDVVSACEETIAVLLTGPSTAKVEFVKFLHRQSPQTAVRIRALETWEHVTDHKLLDEGRQLFTTPESSSLRLGGANSAAKLDAPRPGMQPEAE